MASSSARDCVETGITQTSETETDRGARALRRFFPLLPRVPVGSKSGRHVLLRPPLCFERDGGKHLLVCRRERRLYQPPRPEVTRSHHIELRGIQGDLGGQI